jgi:rubredoxin
VLPTPAQEDDRRRGAGLRGAGRRLGGAFVRRGFAHRQDDNLRPVSTETQTKQLWVCTSCGFIYDPDDGDPDGGIPPGTPFDEIPDDWFCPVCGARKADFEPYEE